MFNFSRPFAVLQQQHVYSSRPFAVLQQQCLTPPVLSPSCNSNMVNPSHSFAVLQNSNMVNSSRPFAVLQQQHG
jgi:hypothetical protein